MSGRRRSIPVLVAALVLGALSWQVQSPAAASVQGVKTTIASTDPNAAPVTSVAVGPDGTVYAPVAVPGQYAIPFVSSGVVKAFHPDGRVDDTAWSFTWPSDDAPGYPLSLGVDGAGDLFGYVARYDQQTGVISQEVWELAAGASAPQRLPFTLPNIGGYDPSGYADLVVSDSGDVVVKDESSSSLWLLRAGESTPVGLPAGLGWIQDLAATADGTLYALGQQLNGTDEVIRRLPAGTTDWETLPADVNDAAVKQAQRITVDDQGNVFTLGSQTNGSALWRLPGGATPAEQVTAFTGSAYTASEMAAVGHQAVVLAPGGESTVTSVALRTRTAVAADAYQVVRGPAPLTIDAHDANGDVLAFHVTTEPTHGSLTGEYPDITYAPAPGYLGRDSLTYTVASPNGTWATATTTISVRKPLVVEGDGWKQTTIYDVDRYDGQTPYSVAVDDHGTTFFPVENTQTGYGQVVAQTPDGRQTPTAWTIEPWYINYPYSMDADAHGNLYGTVVIDGYGDAAARMLPAGGDHLIDLPFPTATQVYSVPPAIDASPNGDVAMSDFAAGKVYVLRAGAASPTELPLPAGFRPLDLAVAQNGIVHVLGSVGTPAQTWEVVSMHLDGTGTEVRTVAGYPTGIAVTDDGTVYLTAYLQSVNSYGVGRLGPDGSLTPVSGPLDLYTAWNDLEVDRNGSLYVPEIWGDRLVRIDFPGHNSPPVAVDSQRSVRGGRSSGLVLSASDPDGDALTYAVTEGPGHGSLTGFAPDLTYTPATGYTGPDSVSYTVDDGNGGTAQATVSITVTDPETGVSSVSQPAAEGQTVATGADPTSDEPSQAAVTTPVAGPVTITQDGSVSDPTGYAVVGAQYRIDAPHASTEAPLRLEFQLAADQLPAGQSALDVAVFRDGVLIADCADQSGTATPDPCVLSRAVTDGVLTIVVLSSHASAWTLAVRQVATTTTLSPIAPSTYGQAISLTATVVQAGSVKPSGTVEFRDTSTPATVLGTAPVGADGTAQLADVHLGAGEHAVVASYSGSGTSLPSTSAPVTASVAKAPVVLSTKATAGLLSVLTLKVTYSTTVTSGITGQPLAGISVTTKINNGAASTGCTAVTNAKGVATCSAGPVNIALGGGYTAISAATASYKAGTASGRLPVL